MIDALGRLGVGSALGAVVMTAITACTVPAVGEIAISRGADGSLTAHTKICDGSAHIDGLTVYGPGVPDLDVEPVEGLSDESSWPVTIERTGAMGLPPPTSRSTITVYGWTRNNSSSLDGPSAARADWEGLEAGELLHLKDNDNDGIADGGISRGLSVEDWYAGVCG